MDLSLTLCYLLIRFLIPITLGAAVILRQNLFSLLYLILLFVGPLLKTPNPQNVLNGCNGYYLIAIICLSALINSAHIIFQIVLVIATNYKTAIDYCSTIGQIYNLIGFHRYNDLSVFNILRLCCLDFVVLIVTCLVYAFCVHSYNAKLARDSSRDNISRPVARRQTEAGFSVESMSLQVARHVYERQHQLTKKRQMREKADRLTYYFVEGIFCMLLCAAAILEPSIISAVYFLYFLFIGTWFAFSCKFGLGYHYFRIFIASFVVVHFTLIYLYQFLIVRPLLPPDNINARLFGFVEYVNTTCNNVREYDFNSYHFVRFFHPFTLVLLYFVSVNLIRSVLISKKYLASDLPLPPATVFFPFPSIASDRTSSGFLSQLLHNASSNLKRNSRANSFLQENATLLYQSLHAGNSKPGFTGLTDGGDYTEEQTADKGHREKPYVAESVHVNRTYDANAVCSTDLTPLLQDDKMGKNYHSARNGGTQVAPVSPSGRLPIEDTANKLDSSSNAHSSFSHSICTPSAPNTPNIAQHSISHPTEGKFGLFFSQIVNMIKHGSYVITLIVMMTWSITYHSWLSFALLLASCIIWMTPNSRQVCLRSSPVLVMYAIVLLIGQYVYSLNLDDQELPTSIGRVSISEIGFRKYFEFSYQPLFIKIIYTVFFWITLRQYSETFGRTETGFDVAQGVLPPLFNIAAGPSRQMSVAPAPTVYKSEIFDWLVKFFHELLIKYWIWVVAGMLMAMSLSGSKVVIYRIVYMFLFLTFTIMFQLSLKWWRKLMYPFWLVVILYSMIILIAIYTYQFNNFPTYWWDYLYINKELQEDLGLVVYDNDAFVLFNELLTPTFFIIITIIQVHFVHRDFLEFSNIDGILVQIQNPSSETSNNEVAVSEDLNASSSKTSFDHSDVKVDIDMSQSEVSSLQTVISKKPTKRPMSPRAQETQMLRSLSDSYKESVAKDTSKRSFLNEMNQLMVKCYHYMESLICSLMIVFWRLLEIHILKLVLLCAVIIAMKDICAMNVLFVCLTVFLMVFSKFERIVCSFFGIWAGILVLLKMLFQLNIAQRIEWHTNCTSQNSTTPIDIDNRIYIGFLKKDDIFNYISEYILLIVILVFRSVILLRQHIYRHKEYGSRRLLEGVVFQDVTRSLADKDFVHFLKYTLNFGFYKFGVEICLIMLTISIANRSDIFSVFYCLWLLIFILLNRQGNEKTWPYFVGFLAIVMPYQYLMCLGIPPGLCLSYPWSFSKSVREWYFLPDFNDKLPKEKLYLDFLVFFFACRQLIVFRLEKVLAFAGGSNLEAHKETTTTTVPDFFSFGNSIFDSIKSFFFFCFFWMTLAVLFLAGTTRINLFGLGYVLGSFIFLWTGNEFYLKPIKVIFKSWKSIIAYTCITMLLKSIMQLFVMPMLKYELCWLIQLLGIRSYDLESQRRSGADGKCETEEAGLLWDGISFTFLLIQKRIFCSHYFKHLIREIKAQHFLASRGAELIHEIQAKEVAEQEMAEREVMEKIKQKMDRIKAAQQRMFADKARSIKYHKQDEFDYDISPYSAADETLSNVSACDELLSQTLPTVYSPTPSIPTITSPQSATSLQPGYFEVYKVCPIRAIDSSISSATMPSFSFASPTEMASSAQSFALNVPTGKPHVLWPAKPSAEHRSEESSIFVSSTRTQVFVRSRDQPPSRKQSFISHSSSVKSGGYYMFEDFDSEYVDLNHNTRESLIPDPEGNEMRNLAKSKGFTAFCSKIFKGEEITDAALVSAEATDIGESSKDSAIVSVERPKYDPDMSKPTASTSVASTSQGTDISNLPSLGSHSQATAKDADKKLEAIAPDPNWEVIPEEVVQETYMQKISNGFAFVRDFFESILISATSSLNSVSRDYRFVAKRLSVEKKCIKRVIEIEESKGNTHDFISDSAWRKSALSKLSRVTEDTLEHLVKSNPKKAIKQWNRLDTTPAEEDKNIYYATLDAKYLETSIYVHFLQAIFYAILSRSEVMCYITIVLNQITTATILSMPLPIFAFLWGSLSVPRPSKSFWVTCITYIEVVVVTKYIFQFSFWPWSTEVQLSPFWWPRIVGIEKMENYANYDLFLLLVLFFHRFMLKSLGLWDISETEMKAYMTNAELIQSEIDKQENGNDKDKKVNKASKKKSKTKSKADKLVNQSDSSELASSNENEVSGAISTREVDFYEIDEDDDESSSEFNVIYFLMNAPKRIKLRVKATVKPVTKFFHNVLEPPYRITHDVYSLMFLCDFINFFILVFGFYAFGSGYSGSSDVAKFLEENRIPIGFLITLLVQFAQIIIDRAIYLRKYIKGKLIFEIIIVIFTHIWLFFILPAMTDKPFTDSSNFPPKLWYIFKCIYFLLSAYQIRSGYPTRILGNTFCKKYNFVNWYLFKMYMIVPFLYDLRMYMDWIWTDTSLVLDEWSLMEDIFVNLYQRKCELQLDEEFPEPRGKAKKRFFKYLIGGSWVIIIIALIWGPLGLFAFGRAVGDVNPPQGATFELEIAGFQPLFKMSVTGNGLETISNDKWLRLYDAFKKNAVAQNFINGYDSKDVFIANLNGNSTAVWGISPPSQQILEEELTKNVTLSMKLTYSIMRKKATKTQDMDTTIYDEHVIELDPIRDKALRDSLANMINSGVSANAIIPNIFPNYLRAPEKGKPSVVSELLVKNSAGQTNSTFSYRSILILMQKGSYDTNSSLTSWWEVHDNCQEKNKDLDDFISYLLSEQKCQYLPVVIFNDKVFIGLLAFLSGYGIIGIYTTFVFLVSRWVRGLNSESSFKVIYTRMPNVDRVLQLCLDIYLVRESREFELEEDLYAKLIFLYRDPQLLIKWTKIPEEIANANQNVQNVIRTN